MAAAEPPFHQLAVPIAVGVYVLTPVMEAGTDSDSDSVGYITASAWTFSVQPSYWLYGRSRKF